MTFRLVCHRIPSITRFSLKRCLMRQPLLLRRGQYLALQILVPLSRSTRCLPEQSEPERRGLGRQVARQSGLLDPCPAPTSTSTRIPPTSTRTSTPTVTSTNTATATATNTATATSTNTATDKPTYDYDCSNSNALGVPLGTSDLSINPIFCSYPVVAGENPDDYYCTYSDVNGALVEDHDAGNCPPGAFPDK